MIRFQTSIYRLARMGRAAAGLCMLVAAVACSRSPLGAGQGSITLSLQQDETLHLKSGLTPLSEEEVYVVDIINEQGDTVATYQDSRNIEVITLPEGVYTVAAYNKVEPTEAYGFGRPRYAGSQAVTIKAGKNSPVGIICKLANVKVTVLDFEQEIKDNFPGYSLVVKPTYDYTGSDTLTFTQADADGGQTGWIMPTDKGSFVLIFRAANHQSPDKTQIYVRTIADAVPADYYRFTVKMDTQSDPSDGGSMFRLSVQTDVNEYEFPFGIMGHTRPIPVISREDGGDIQDPLTTNVDSRDGLIRLNVHADASIKRLRVRHESGDVLLKYGLPGMVNLGGDNDMATDEAQREPLAEVMTWKEGTVVGVTDTWIDLSPLMNTAKLDGVLLPEGNYEVEVEVYDMDNQMVSQTVTLSVARDFATGGAMSGQLLNGIPGVGAKYAYVTAQWIGSEIPTGLAFEYRVLGTGEDAWQKATVAEADIDSESKSFVGLITGLNPETIYEVRPVGDGLSAGAVAVFQTEKFVAIPNLDFEGGQYGSFDGASGVYDPNIPGQTRFWATGNPGGKYTVLGIGLDKNVTLPVTDAEARTGTALWMTSYYVSKAGVTSLATGTIFSGTFGPITSAPTNSDAQRALVHYGQSYAARPLGLKGWYKYIPKTIDTDIDNKYPDLKGQSDKCKIYISLEAWGAGVSTRPAKPVVVGYGELLSEATNGVPEQNNGYVPFEFKVTYTSTTVPDHIVMCATCSYLSDDFCGGAGSSLYIDDFELIWEPDKLAQP